MLPVDFVGIPMVGSAVQYHFDHFGLRAGDEWHAFTNKVNMWGGYDGHRSSPVAANERSYSSGKISSTVRCKSGSACEAIVSPSPYNPMRSIRSGES